MTKHECKNCKYFREAPWDAPRTGCWHEDNMETSLSARFNDEQQEPGNHIKINLRGDCAQYESKSAGLSLWEKFLNWGAA